MYHSLLTASYPIFVQTHSLSSQSQAFTKFSVSTYVTESAEQFSYSHHMLAFTVEYNQVHGILY